MNRELCQLWLECDDTAEASKISRALLDARLIVYAKQLPVEADYRWKGRVEHANGVLLVMEGALDLFDIIEDYVREMHSYATFVLQAFLMPRVSREAMEWMQNELLEPQPMYDRESMPTGGYVDPVEPVVQGGSERGMEPQDTGHAPLNEPEREERKAPKETNEPNEQMEPENQEYQESQESQEPHESSEDAGQVISVQNRSKNRVEARQPSKGGRFRIHIK